MSYLATELSVHCPAVPRGPGRSPWDRSEILPPHVGRGPWLAGPRECRTTSAVAAGGRGHEHMPAPRATSRRARTRGSTPAQAARPCSSSICARCVRSAPPSSAAAGAREGQDELPDAVRDALAGFNLCLRPEARTRRRSTARLRRHRRASATGDTRTRRSPSNRPARQGRRGRRRRSCPGQWPRPRSPHRRATGLPGRARRTCPSGRPATGHRRCRTRRSRLDPSSGLCRTRPRRSPGTT